MKMLGGHLQQLFDDQHFANDYHLVNGVTMHAENPRTALSPSLT
jgi:hypothetical protein